MAQRRYWILQGLQGCASGLRATTCSPFFQYFPFSLESTYSLLTRININIRFIEIGSNSAGNRPQKFGYFCQKFSFHPLFVFHGYYLSFYAFFLPTNLINFIWEKSIRLIENKKTNSNQNAKSRHSLLIVVPAVMLGQTLKLHRNLRLLILKLKTPVIQCLCSNRIWNNIGLPPTHLLFAVIVSRAF